MNPFASTPTMDFVDESAVQAAPLVQLLIGLVESRRLEFKRVSGKMVGKALETVCGLANAEGGVLPATLLDFI
ncbi:MAG TPA: hypothetical protein VIM34_17945 [Burkholderiaceae bacterium]